MNTRAAAPEKLIVATGNAGKLREFRTLLANLPFVLESQTALGIAAVEETGASFVDNALLKARHAARATGSAALADDSGLEVDALGGAPGLYSARYAGAAASDEANNAKLRAALTGVPREQRAARYRCALVFVGGPMDAQPIVAEGVWEGIVIDTPRGAGGFGYDPYFFLPALNRTAAELRDEEKNRISHRGIALRELEQRLRLRTAQT